MRYCCVPFCRSDSRKENVSFHDFPADIDLCNQWLLIISRENFVPNDKSNSSKVCGKHFKEEDFIQHRNRRCLKRGVIPSVFPPGHPSYKKAMANQNFDERKRKLENTDSIIPSKSKLAKTHSCSSSDADLLMYFANSLVNSFSTETPQPTCDVHLIPVEERKK